MNWKKKHYMELCGEFAFEESTDLSEDRQRK